MKETTVVFLRNSVSWKPQLDTEYTEASTERTEKCSRKVPECTITQQVNSNSRITTQ
jgi:hypothetical protein